MKDTTDAVNSYENSIRFYNKNYYIDSFLETSYFKKRDLDKARYYKQLYDDAPKPKKQLDSLKWLP